jgi:uncharacterized protein (DUF58 family)
MGQRDAAGLAVFDTAIRSFAPARLRPSHLLHLINTLEAATPGGDTSLEVPLHHVAETIKRRGLVVLISDLLSDPERLAPALQHLRFVGHDVIVFQVLDPHEIEFPFETLTEFTDLETGRRLRTTGRSARALYLREFQAHQKTIHDMLADLKIDYALFDTRMPLDFALAEYLYRRGRAG